MKKEKKKTSKRSREEKPPPSISRPSKAVAAVLLLLTTLLVYANSLDGEFVFDDTVIVQGNETIQGLGVGNLREIFGGHYWKAVESRGGLYRPVTMLSYAVNYALGGEDPAGYHLLNVLLHATNGILLFFIIEGLFSRRTLSILSAALFILHPIRTEGVASVVGRAECLSALFVLLAWWGYLAYRKGKGPLWMTVSVLAFALATLSKESAYSFVFLLPLTDFVIVAEKTVKLRDRFRLWATLLRYLPFAVVLGLSLWARYSVLGGLISLYINPNSNPLLHASDWSRFLTATYVFGRYLWLLIFPLHLSADYSYNQIPLVHEILSLRALFPLAVLVLILIATVISARRSPFLFFGSCLFFSSFLLTSNWLRPIGTIMAERLLYFPSIGLTCVLAYLLCKGLENERWKIAASAVSVAVLALYGFRTMDRNRDWKNHFRLFDSAVRVSPNSFLVQSNYATILLNERKDALGAIRHALRATQINGEDPAARFTLGQAYVQTGRMEEAVDAFENVVRLAPGTSGGTSALRSLARVHETLGMDTQAIADYEKMREWRPKDISACTALERLYRKVGQHERADQILERSRQLK